MNANIDAIVDKIGSMSGHDVTLHSQEVLDRIAYYKAKEASEKGAALSYLRAKFPGVPDSVFTDSDSFRAHDIMEACKIEAICDNCNGGKCELPDRVRQRNSRPFVSLEEDFRGEKFLIIRWTNELPCRFNPLTGDFGRMFRKSGLTKFQVQQTFKNFEVDKNTLDLLNAREKAAQAAREGSCLIIAGKAGTGKTHLAVAIAIFAMKQGKQAIFRVVSEMLNEIWEAIATNGDFFGLMRTFKEAECLVLDDFGKENITNARISYLHEIVDYRYRHGLQTIVTTNAKSPEELSHWSNAEFITPIISRLEEQGEWITITNADDFRSKKGKVSSHGK